MTSRLPLMGLFVLLAAPLAAQTPTDSVYRSLDRYCAQKAQNVPQYMRPACRNYPKIKADTVRITVHDTVRVTVHDTVYVKPDTAKPPIPPADTVKPPPLPVDSTVQPPALLTTTVASTPSTGRTIDVVNLQAAFDSAQFGDRVVLPCGATYTGNFRLEPKSIGFMATARNFFSKITFRLVSASAPPGWVTVQSSCNLPVEGARTGPTQTFATITSPNVLPAIATNGAASRWRFIGVEVTTSAATNQGLIALGCASQCETSLSQQPSDIIFDRSYIHAPASTDVRRCIGLNGARLAVIDSYVDECHSAFDAQAIAGWNGPGPFKITNNYLAGAAENIAFGGGDPVSGVGVVPSDIEIRRNHITKPMEWKGSQWLIKNLLELKQGKRVVIEGNVFENSWASAQDFAFVLWSVNQQTTCTWCEVAHVLIQNNTIRNVAGGFSLNATGSNDLPQYKAVTMNHVTIRNNVLIGVNADGGGNGKIFQMNNPIQFLSIEHNTGFSPNASSFLWGSTLPLPNHVVKNNLVGGGQYQLFTVYGQGQIAWDHAGGVGSTFDHNAVAQFSGGPWIAANWADSFAAFGIARPYDVTATLDDFILPATSILKGKATDGRDVGADIAAIKAAIAGVVKP